MVARDIVMVDVFVSVVSKISQDEEYSVGINSFLGRRGYSEDEHTIELPS